MSSHCVYGIQCTQNKHQGLLHHYNNAPIPVYSLSSKLFLYILEIFAIDYNFYGITVHSQPPVSRMGAIDVACNEIACGHLFEKSGVGDALAPRHRRTVLSSFGTPCVILIERRQ